MASLDVAENIGLVAPRTAAEENAFDCTAESLPNGTKCPICFVPRFSPRFEKHGYWINDCPNCQHRFTFPSQPGSHVESTYGDDYFRGGGAGYPDYLAEGELLREHGRRYGAVLSGLAKTGSILDVGSAAGFILRGLVDSGWNGRGIEPNAGMASHARQQVGVDVQVGTLECATLDNLSAAGQFDAVTMIQVIGHFYDLRRALESAAALTRPGGLWLVEAWDRGSLPARALGKAWHEYSPPSVLHWFTRKSLADIVRLYGFVEIAHGRPKKWIRMAHAKSLLEHSLGKLARFAPTSLLSGQASIPYPALDVFWAVYRRQ